MARPTKYKTEYNVMAYKLALLGADDKQLADFFEVAKSTINRWKLEESEFSDSLKKGKEIADATIAEKLYNRAKGYSYTEVKKVEDKDGNIRETTITEKELPPDTTAQIFWLKNRQPKLWRDKQEIDHSGATFEVTIDKNGKDKD